jgi:hypothetical protein
MYAMASVDEAPVLAANDPLLAPFLNARDAAARERALCSR